MSRRVVLAAAGAAFGAALVVAGILLATSGEEAPQRARKANVVRADEAPARRRRAPRTARGLAGALQRERLAGQLMLVGFEGTEALAPFFAQLSGVDFGGVLLEERNFLSPDQFAALIGEIGVVARNARHLPPVVAAGGELAALTPAELAATGVDLVTGPLADVGTGGGGGETLGDDPETVRRRALAAARAFAQAGIGVAPRHFPGQGAANQEPLEGPAVVGSPREQVLSRDVAPFAALLRRADAVVVSNAAYVGWDAVTPAAHTPALVRDLLRKRLRFRGVAIADNVLGATSLTGEGAGEAAVAAVRAGCDMVYVRDEEEREEVYRALIAALRTGKLPGARARQAAARVLELKRRVGALAPAPGG